MACCGSCGLTFKPFTPSLQREVAQIYKSYKIYHQSKGGEQRVWDFQCDRLLPRSQILVRRIFDSTAVLPAKGTCLDVGCGNGAFLAALANIKPQWLLYGTEKNKRHQTQLRRIKGFKKLFAGGTGLTQNLRLDLVSLIHLLEHIDKPVSLLSRLASHLNADGRLFVECPDMPQNPFDLLIADHILHFTPQTLKRLAAQAGLECLIPKKRWVSKEISALLRMKKVDVDPPTPASDRTLLQKHIRWLQSVVLQAQTLSRDSAIGIFGTSIAGTWLAGEKGIRWNFFVDEDPSRAGTIYLNKRVLSAKNVPKNQTVFIPLAPEVATSIRDRLQKSFPQTKWVSPEAG